MSGPTCPKCSRPMQLLDSEAQRYYCYKDDVVFLGSENRWNGLAPATPPSTTQTAAQPLSPEKRQEARMIAILGIVLIIIALFVVPLVIYPIVAVAIVVAMRFLISQSAGQQVRKGTAPWKAEQSRSSIPPVPWMLNTCPNCGAAMSELGTRFYCAKDDILIHKATGFMIDGVPRTEWQRLIDARVSIRGERGEYLISLSNEALIITDDDGKRERTIPLSDLKSASITDGDVNTLQLVTEKEHLMLRTIDPKLWKENVERRMEQSRRVAAVPPEASEAKIHKSKFCINCGAPLQANATFCVECGSKQ